MEIWFQDEARAGQKNKITRAGHGAEPAYRPRRINGQKSAHLFGAICPEHGMGAGLLLSFCQSLNNVTPADAYFGRARNPLIFAAICANCSDDRHLGTPIATAEGSELGLAIDGANWRVPILCRWSPDVNELTIRLIG